MDWFAVDPFSLSASDDDDDEDDDREYWTPPSSPSWCRVTEIVTWNEEIVGFEHQLLFEEPPFPKQSPDPRLQQ